MYNLTHKFHHLEGASQGPYRTGGMLPAALLKWAETENNLHTPQWGPGRISRAASVSWNTCSHQEGWARVRPAEQGKACFTHLCAYPFMSEKNTSAIYGLGLNCLAWRIPWTEDPCELWTVGSQRVRHDWATNTFTFQVSFNILWAWFRLNLTRIKTPKRNLCYHLTHS